MGSLVRWYNNFVSERQDEYTKDWFMVGSLGKLLLILAGYIYFCTKLGPRLMKDRKPFKLTRTIQIYNIFQVFANAFLVYEGIQSGWFTLYDMKCQPVDYSDSPSAHRMRRAVYYYYLIKLTDLLDTVFFVLRKKYNQVTFLHIYHHSLMPFCSYVGVTFVPGGHGSLLGVCNAFVHVVLYSYYFLSSLGPEVQKYLWWKKHVTKLQLVQFVIILVHNVQVLPRNCNYPKIFNVLLSIQAGYFIYLFGSFYVRAYIEKKPQTTIIKNELKEKVEENGNTIIPNGKHQFNGMHNGHSTHTSNGYISNGHALNGNATTIKQAKSN
ncbi:elongation of very long chain fatty acids protein 7-like [Anthonomus grandis grandis]|uniref:elongation of very long chain fatty acids protein 7-like n=1 Tax=Anthonomus grandis grandis TaxID=2921223 RepID=UPI002165E103|nr:elongation of very long chain fatty acids protein 7-like [Anthonomus grandis grandis]